MQYIYVNWKHSYPDEPIDLYIEVNDSGWEIRKVEIFRDGRVGIASLSKSSNSTKLGREKIPSIEEIAMDAQFSPKQITKDDFEKVWDLSSGETQSLK